MVQPFRLGGQYIAPKRTEIGPQADFIGAMFGFDGVHGHEITPLYRAIGVVIRDLDGARSAKRCANVIGPAVMRK